MTNTTTSGFKYRCQLVLQKATELRPQATDWVTFFRDTLGSDGAARSVFDTQEEYLQFEKSPEFEEIQSMVSSLRSQKPAKQNEDTKVITVRLPESLHESLKEEARQHKTSMNKLCITKLLQALIEEEEENQARQAMSSNDRTGGPTSQGNPANVHSNIPMDTRTSGSTNFRSTYDQR